MASLFISSTTNWKCQGLDLSPSAHKAEAVPLRHSPPPPNYLYVLQVLQVFTQESWPGRWDLSKGVYWTIGITLMKKYSLCYSKLLNWLNATKLTNSLPSWMKWTVFAHSGRCLQTTGAKNIKGLLACLSHCDDNPSAQLFFARSFNSTMQNPTGHCSTDWLKSSGKLMQQEDAPCRHKTTLIKRSKKKAKN